MLKRFFPLFLLLFLLITENVYAFTDDGYVESGDSVKGTFKIGSNNIGSSYYFIDTQQINQAGLDGSFDTITKLNLGNNPYGTYNGIFHFYVDYCVTGVYYNFSIYSTYFNFVDYTYNLGSSVYLDEGDWARATCYRSFIRLRLNYSQTIPLDNGGKYHITNYSNTFAFGNQNSYGILLRYTDLVYLNESDYSSMLTSIKTNTNSQTIISQNNTIISQNNEIDQSIDSVKDSVDDLNDSINNSDTTQANSTGNSWFSGFRVDSTRGFSSIITAPIRLIQGILNGSNSCSALSFDVSLKDNSTTQSNEVSLPCGSILWNNVPNTAVLLYHSTIFGLFAWFVLSDMYKFIDSIRDPDNKSEFVMKL